MSLKHVNKRIIIKADKDGKNWHTFSDGSKIRLEREFNNLDRKHTSQVLGEVISCDYIPSGALILFHHNGIHPVNKISNHTQLNGEEIASGIEIYSLSENECFLWKMPGDKKWNPLKGFATALRIFKPYSGKIEGILPEKVKEVLYITSGELNGKVCHTLKACDFPIIFNDENGMEETIIRVRHFEGKDLNEREEIIAINKEMTKLVKNGKLHVGVNSNNCKQLNYDNL
jgi:hypothetical protein